MAWSPERGCNSKQGFLFKKEAKWASRSMNTDNTLRGEPLTHIYKCPGCRLYHIGRPIGLRSEVA